MSQDLYEILEVPENANDVWIRRAYELKRNALDADQSASAEVRQLRIIAVEKAFNTLSNPAARERYDERHLSNLSVQVPKDGAATYFSSWVKVALVVFVLLAALAYWQTERLRVERERIAAEVAVKMRELAQKEVSQREALKLVGKGMERDEEERRASREERERRNSESLRNRDETNARAYQRYTQGMARNAQISQQGEERQQRAEEEAQRRQAQAEVDRQKRWLDQLAREDQEIRERRAASSRIEQNRVDAPESRIIIIRR